MPEFKDSSRYSITDPADPTRWQDLTVAGDDGLLDVVDVRESVRLFRVLVPRGVVHHGAEFQMFRRDASPMDSSWNRDGKLPRREVGIVHRVGVAIAPYVCDQRTDGDDIAKVIANAHLAVAVNQEPILAGSLETLPIGLGVTQTVSNGLPAADAVPERFPLIYVNPSMHWEGTLSFPHRNWLYEAGAGAAAPTHHDSGGEDGGDTTPNCPPTSGSGSRPCVTLESDVLLTFYMAGVFGRVREDG